MRRAKAIWVELIRQQERSGVSDEEYAKKRNIPVATFRWWVWKLKREAVEKPSLLPVRVIGSAAPWARCSKDGAAEVEAEFPDGLRVRFTDGTSSARVVEVVSRLRRC